MPDLSSARRIPGLLMWIIIASLTVAQTPSHYLNYTIQDNSVTITGYNDLPISNLEIPSSIGGYVVTAIAPDAFRGESDLLRVSIPQSITAIGNMAFADCASLIAIEVAAANPMYTSVDGVLYNKSMTELIQFKTAFDGLFHVPATVTAIADKAFSLCNDLTDVTLPPGLIWIGEESFNGCASLIEIHFPDNLQAIGRKAFNNCSSLMQVSVPASVVSIGDGPFAECNGLLEIAVAEANPSYSSVNGYLFNKDKTHFIQAAGAQGGNYVLPSTVSTVHSFAFDGCDDLLVIAIPASVTSIGEGVFDSCYLLSRILVEPSNPNYANYNNDSVLYSKDLTELLRFPQRKNESEQLAYSIPYGVEVIAKGAFRSCRLPGVNIPQSVITIGDYAFSDCDSFTSIAIPGSVTSIGDNAFYSCDELLTVNLSDYLQSIGARAFSYCRKLNGITLGYQVASIGERAFTYCNAITSFSVAAANAYYRSENGVLFNRDMTELVQYPGAKTGSYSIPSTVTSVLEGAFFDNNSLQTVSVPSSVQDLGKTPFLSCRNLVTIDVDLFNNRYSSESGVLFSKDKTHLIQYPQARAGDYTVPTNVEIIAPYAFNDCDQLTSVAMPSVIQVGSYAFFGTDKITSISLDDKLTAVGYKAFGGCDNLANVAVSESLRSLGELVFSDCINLTQFTVAAGNPWYSSMDGVLYNKSKTVLIRCPELQQGVFSMPDSVTTLPQYAFENCSGISSITLSENLTSIGPYAFTGCGFEQLILPDSLLVIGPYASYNNQLLRSVRIPSGVRSIGRNAFYNCYALIEAYIPTGITWIGEAAFYNCDSLRTVWIPETTKYIGELAFARCPMLENAYFHGEMPLTPAGPGIFSKYETGGVTSFYIDIYTGWEDEFSRNPTAVFIPSPWYQATLFSSGWQYIDWMGWFVDFRDGWIFHRDVEWMFTYPVQLGEFYYFDQNQSAWNWSSDVIFPHVYSFVPPEQWILHP